MEENYQRILGNLQLTDKDTSLIHAIYPFVAEHIGEIVDEIVDTLAQEPRVIDILTNNQVSVPAAKSVWGDIIKYILSHDVDAEFFARLSKVGVVHVVKKVEEDLVIEAITLFGNTILKKMNEYDIHPKIDHILALNRRMGLAAVVIISSYRDEKEANDRALARFIGIKDELLERLVELGRKAK